MEKQIFKLHWSKCMFIYRFSWFDYHVHTQLNVCLQYNTALTNREQKLHMYFAQGLLQRPKGQCECIKTAGEAHSRIYSTLSVPRSSNPVLFTLQFTFCLCTWVSFQSGSAKGEREEWCTPESCSDLQPAHNWTGKGHLHYVSLKEFGITNATQSWEGEGLKEPCGQPKMTEASSFYQTVFPKGIGGGGKETSWIKRCSLIFNCSCYPYLQPFLYFGDYQRSKIGHFRTC